jgi:hypothetical protein
VIFAILSQVAARDASALENSISALHKAISALESKINCLEHSLSSWDSWVLVASAVVVIGVVLELLVIRHEWNEKDEDWALGHFGIRREALKPSIKDFRWQVAAVLLVTLGIGGEFGIGLKIRSIDSRVRASSAELRSKSDQLLALTTELAGDAATSARTAHDELSTVRTEAGTIKTQLEAVSKRAKVIGLQLNFRGARAELLNGRSIEILRKGLKPFSGQKVEIRTNLSEIPDPEMRQEARLLALQLDFFLYAACDWAVSNGEGGGAWGVRVVVNRKALRETREAAEALAKGLGEIGLTGMNREKPKVDEAQEGSVIDRTNFASDTILLFVGRHP